MKTFKEIINERGLSVSEIAKQGMPYQTVYKHYTGERSVSAKHALMYEKLFDIPKHELCPQFWSDVKEAQNAD